MNSILSRVMGVNESAVPVVSTVPSERHAARNRINRKRRRQGSIVAQAMGMVGESDEESVFPDEREEGEPASASELDKLPVVKETPAEPANPYDQADEQGIPPSVALVAPDVTPQALIPLDASKIPSFKETTFTTTQADAAAAPQEAPGAGGDAIDAILGRPTEELEPEPGPPAPRVVSTAEAQSMLGIKPVSIMEDAGGDGLGYLKPGSEMPEHRDGDVKKIMSTFRRFSK